MSRSEQGVAPAQRPVTGRPRRGQLGIDIDLDRTEEVADRALVGEQ
ncbi:hypothetical protein ABZ942_42500 [Nocardia sp. NPDC046473]